MIPQSRTQNIWEGCPRTGLAGLRCFLLRTLSLGTKSRKNRSQIFLHPMCSWEEVTSGKCIFATDRPLQKPTTEHNLELWSPFPTDHSSTTMLPTLKAQGSFQKRGWKVCKSQKFSVRLCLLEMSEKLHPWSLTNKDNTNRCANMKGRKLRRCQLYTKNRPLKSAGNRRNSPPHGRAQNWLSSTKWSALKMYIQVALLRLVKLYLYV